MKQSKINRLCDKTLKLLYKNRHDKPLLYHRGKYREGDMSNDLFTTLKVNEEDGFTVIQCLLSEGLIKILRGKPTYTRYDHERESELVSDVTKVLISEDGKLFIQTGSHVKEARSRWLRDWIPMLLSCISVVISVVAIIVSTSDSKEQKLEQAKTLRTIEQRLLESERRNARYGDSALTKVRRDTAR